MTEYFIDPEDVVADFLRTYLTDPRARAEASKTDAVTATAGQTQITITAPSGTVSAITALTVNAASKSKWKDYFWDYQNQKITFYTALTLNDAVSITYKYGTSNWIYSDRPNSQLSSSNFPRIAIFTVSNPSTRLGQYNAPAESSIVLQADIWSKEGYSATISSRTYSNTYLVRYLGNQITRAFEKYESDLFPVLYAYRAVSAVKSAPFSEEYVAHHGIVEIGLKGLRTGRIEV